MFRIFSILLFIFPFLPSKAQNKVETAIQDFTKYAAFQNAGISICVTDLAFNKIIGEHQKNLALPPASTVKLFSTASAIEILGDEYIPSTKFYHDGELKPNGILEGNIYIKGGGDPTLGSKYFNSEGRENYFFSDWIRELKNLNIKKIQGKIIIDGSDFGYLGNPEGWNWSDIGNYYGAGPSGIVLRDNMLKYYFKTAEVGNPTVLLRTEPKIDHLKLVNTITAGKHSDDQSLIFGGPFSYDRIATGTLPSGRREFLVKGSLPDPEHQLAKEFYEALQTENFAVEGFDHVRNYFIQNLSMPNYQKMKPLFSWNGKKVEEIVHHTNMKSVNLFAEQLVCLIGKEKTGKGTTENGLAEMMKFWNGKMDISGLHLTDGSGLSRNNAVSSRHFCDLLYFVSKSDKFSIFKTSLPTAGQSGTLINVCKGQDGEGRIFAKSGTMNKIKSYAGYVKTKSGKELSFAIVVNNFNCSNSNTVDQIEKLLNAMVNY